MGFRKPHFLTRPKRSTFPTTVVFVDTETHQIALRDGSILHTLRLGVAAYCRTSGSGILTKRDQLVFHDAATFWDWCVSHCTTKRTLYVVSHNIPFDATVLDAFTELPRRGFQLVSFYTKFTTSIFKFDCQSRCLVLLDNANFFTGKLAEWGDVIGLPKLAVNFNTTCDDDLITYCTRDVDILIELWRHWYKFLQDHDLGGFKTTLASTAFNAFRYRYLSHRVYLHDDDKVQQLERESYHGGRVEVLFQGHREDGWFGYADVNSMYPYVMAAHEYPISLCGYERGYSLHKLARRLERYAVIARVRVNVSQPVFPYRLNGRLCYPLGHFETVLTTPELEYALERGWIEEVLESAYYRQSNLFSDYVNDLYSLKVSYGQSGNRPMMTLIKLLLNGLYGKFGQTGLSIECVGDCPPHITRSETVIDYHTRERYQVVMVGGSVFTIKNEGESYNCFPAIASHVTAYARLHLAKLMLQTQPKHCYYLDTDSLILDWDGYERLMDWIHPTELGKLKVETESDWIEIRAPKDYSMAGRERVKGLSSQAVRLADDTYADWHFQGFRGMLNTGYHEGILQYPVTKRISRQIRTGIVQPDGWVMPFVLS